MEAASERIHGSSKDWQKTRSKEKNITKRKRDET
jgi:hypothetical protein